MRVLNFLLEVPSKYAEMFTVNSRILLCSVSLNASISMDRLRKPFMIGERSMEAKECTWLFLFVAQGS